VFFVHFSLFTVATSAATLPFLKSQHYRTKCNAVIFTARDVEVSWSYRLEFFKKNFTT